jgi:hypothetical protein
MADKYSTVGSLLTFLRGLENPKLKEIGINPDRASYLKFEFEKDSYSVKSVPKETEQWNAIDFQGGYYYPAHRMIEYLEELCKLGHESTLLMRNRLTFLPETRKIEIDASNATSVVYTHISPVGRMLHAFELAKLRLEKESGLHNQSQVEKAIDSIQHLFTGVDPEITGTINLFLVVTDGKPEMITKKQIHGCWMNGEDMMEKEESIVYGEPIKFTIFKITELEYILYRKGVDYWITKKNEERKSRSSLCTSE